MHLFIRNLHLLAMTSEFIELQMANSETWAMTSFLGWGRKINKVNWEVDHSTPLPQTKQNPHVFCLYISQFMVLTLIANSCYESPNKPSNKVQYKAVTTSKFMTMPSHELDMINFYQLLSFRGWFASGLLTWPEMNLFSSSFWQMQSSYL